MTDQNKSGFEVECGRCKSIGKVSLSESWGDVRVYMGYCQPLKHRIYVVVNYHSNDVCVISIPSGIHSNFYFMRLASLEEMFKGSLKTTKRVVDIAGRFNEV